MDEQIKDKIKQLIDEIGKQKDSVSNLKELLNKEIDKDFPINLWELSNRELDSEMGSRLSFLNDDIDTRPTTQSITSHRGLIGKPIVFVKRLFLKLAGFYTNTLFEKQLRFNEQLVAFHLASFIRFRNNEKQIEILMDKIKKLEEEQQIVLEQFIQLEKEKNDID